MSKMTFYKKNSKSVILKVKVSYNCGCLVHIEWASMYTSSYSFFTALKKALIKCICMLVLGQCNSPERMCQSLAFCELGNGNGEDAELQWRCVSEWIMPVWAHQGREEQDVLG